MKKIILMSTTFALLTFLMLSATSCNKYKRQPADTIVGDYLGSGTDASGMPYLNQIVRVSKVSKRRVKVEPVGHSYITAFEVNVIGNENGVVSVEDIEAGLNSEINGETIDLGVSTPQNETFLGTKQ